MAVPKIPNVPGVPEQIGSLDEATSVFARVAAQVAADPSEAMKTLVTVTGNPINIRKIVDPGTFVRRWSEGAQGAGDRWLDGVRNPSADPVQAAIAANGKFKQRVQESLQEDRWVSAMRRRTAEDVVSVAERVGAGAYTGGVAARTQKMERVAGQLIPLLGANKDTIRAMPQDTDAQREARMVANLRNMRQIGKTMKGVAGGGR